MDECVDSVAQSLPDPTEVGANGFAKSQKTRERILEAALDLLAEKGYAATSTPAIARRAALSRTAMLYHFPSRQVLLDAVVHYVTRRRVEMQAEMQADFPRDGSFRDRSVESTWAQLHTREFRAFCELSMAARTDADLSEVFQPALAAFDLARRDMAMQLAEAEVANSPVFDLRRDLHRFLLEGMAQQNGITYDHERRVNQLIATLKLLWSDAGEDFLRHVVEQTET